MGSYKTRFILITRKKFIYQKAHQKMATYQFPVIDFEMVQKCMPKLVSEMSEFAQKMEEQTKSQCSAGYNESFSKCGKKWAEKMAGKKENEIWVPFHRFTKDQLTVTVNKKGLMTVSAAKEQLDESTGRNGQRKTVVHVEETIQLPCYVLEQEKLDTVTGEYKNGFFIITLPEKPKEESEKTETKSDKEGPITIEIMEE